MEETLSIMKNATPRSLAILDELGRGTSTFDGYALAHSVLKHITDRIQCRSLFSTHYHMLLDDYRTYPGVALYHMALRADEHEEKVLFLYRFERGECSNSFGMNIAKMAGLDRKIVMRAR